MNKPFIFVSSLLLLILTTSFVLLSPNQKPQDDKLVQDIYLLNYLLEAKKQTLKNLEKGQKTPKKGHYPEVPFYPNIPYGTQTSDLKQLKAEIQQFERDLRANVLEVIGGQCWPPVYEGVRCPGPPRPCDNPLPPMGCLSVHNKFYNTPMSPKFFDRKGKAITPNNCPKMLPNLGGNVIMKVPVKMGKINPGMAKIVPKNWQKELDKTGGFSIGVEVQCER